MSTATDKALAELARANKRLIRQLKAEGIRDPLREAEALIAREARQRGNDASASELAELDAKMGIVADKPSVRRRGNSLTFGFGNRD